MKYPSAKKLEEIDRKLKDADGAYALPKNATYLEKVKYHLCKHIVAYIRIHRVTQTELADRLKIDQARVSEVVNYKIDKFTIDTLLTYNRLLDSNFEIEIKPAS